MAVVGRSVVVVVVVSSAPCPPDTNRVWTLLEYPKGLHDIFDYFDTVAGNWKRKTVPIHWDGWWWYCQNDSFSGGPGRTKSLVSNDPDSQLVP